jgi:O-antigen/teichoic acid export membrane protein
MFKSVIDWKNRLLKDPRIARVMHGSVSGLAGRVLSLLISVVTLPMTLRYLGRLEYGVWVTVSTSVMMLSILDFGLANTLTNFIAEAHANDNPDLAQRYFSTAFWVTVGLVLLMLPITYGVWRWVDWGRLFHLTDPVLVSHAAGCVAIAGGFFLVSLPLALMHRALSGYQEVHLVNYVFMLNSVLGFIALVTTVLLHGSIVTLLAAYSGAMMVGNVALNLWVWHWQRPWLKPLFSHVDRGIIRRLFGQGLLFFVLQLTTLVVFNSDNLVITHYLSAEAVTPYSVAWRLMQYAFLLQGFLVPSLWPALTEAYHKGQMDWIQNIYRQLRQKTLIAVGIAALVLAVVGRPVIRWWAGSMAVPDQGLLWLMAAFSVVIATTTNQAMLLTATGRLRLEATVAVIAASANLWLSIMLVKWIGSEGVILGTLLSFAVFMVLPQAREVRRVLAGEFLPRTAPESQEVVSQ